MHRHDQRLRILKTHERTHVTVFHNCWVESLLCSQDGRGQQAKRNQITRGMAASDVIIYNSPNPHPQSIW